ncbi:MAG TPA: hypothetical protein VGO97_05680 [Solirubrobacterales bacterium]|nr:hypothetical protein [Solirubrobacterales bacterium]
MSAVRASAHRRRQGPGAFALVFIDWRYLEGARRLALAAALAIAVCAVVGIPDFGWIELTQLVLALCVIRVLARQVEEVPPPLPFHDGTLVCAAAAWTAIVSMINAFDGADTGTELIAIGACAMLFLAGLRMRSLGEDYWFE